VCARQGVAATSWISCVVQGMFWLDTAAECAAKEHEVEMMLICPEDMLKACRHCCCRLPSFQRWRLLCQRLTR
jgi:hypothetical protein